MKRTPSFGYLGLVFTLISGLVAPPSWAALPTQTVPIRGTVHDCKALLVPTTFADDSVGIPLSGNTPEEFRASLEALRNSGDLPLLKNGTFFVQGIPVRQARATEYEFRRILASFGLDTRTIHVKVLSVAPKLFEGGVTAAVNNAWLSFLHWFPNFERHYQKPVTAEVVSGLVSAGVIEVPNVVFLFQRMPTLDAALTVATHTAVLVAYSVWKKFMINWLLEPGTGRLAALMKQVAVSFPFVLNYNLFGNFSTIAEFVQIHGWEATVARFPTELANFATSQGLTLFLQTLFYQVTVTHGVRAWENSQINDKDSLTARTVANYTLVPILALDAMALAAASSGGTPWMEWGSLTVNGGHTALAGLTAAGFTLWIWPNVLNPTIRIYRSIEPLLSWVSSFFPWLTKKEASAREQGHGENQPSEG